MSDGESPMDFLNRCVGGAVIDAAFDGQRSLEVRQAAARIGVTAVRWRDPFGGGWIVTCWRDESGASDVFVEVLS